MRSVVVLLVLVLAAVSASVSQVKFNGDLVNTSVKRSTDVDKSVEQVITRVTVHNTGTEEARSYFVPLTHEHNSHLAFIKVVETDADGKALKRKLSHTIAVPSGHPRKDDFVFHRFILPRPLQADEKMSLKLSMVFTHVLVPKPATVTSDEDQRVQYFGDHYFLSPYATLSQSAKVLLFSSNVESYSKHLSPVKHAGRKITYGPYADVPALTQEPLMIHYLNNAPFTTFTRAEREVEVSHWGNVWVTNKVHVEHSGAKMVKGFQRKQMSSFTKSQGSSYREMTVDLPKAAHSVYFVDKIGNVSSSNLRYERERAVLQLRPRFEMFGGWKNDFEMGYSVPSQEFVSRVTSDPDQYVLEVPFGHEFESAVTDDFTLRVVLPEGVYDIQPVLPFEVDGQSQELRFTVLDTKGGGRPVVVLRKSNLIHATGKIRVHILYRFSQVAILREPMLLVAAFFCFFLVSMFYARLDLEITGTAAASQGKVKAA